MWFSRDARICYAYRWCQSFVSVIVVDKSAREYRNNQVQTLHLCVHDLIMRQLVCQLTLCVRSILKKAVADVQKGFDQEIKRLIGAVEDRRANDPSLKDLSAGSKPLMTKYGLYVSSSAIDTLYTFAEYEGMESVSFCCLCSIVEEFVVLCAYCAVLGWSVSRVCGRGGAESKSANVRFCYLCGGKRLYTLYDGRYTVRIESVNGCIVCVPSMGSVGSRFISGGVMHHLT